MRLPTTTTKRSAGRAGQHRHTKGGCLKILKRLSLYLDGELANEVCREIRVHMGECPRCEVFLDSLRQTVSLCRHLDSKPLSPALKQRLRQEILRVVGRR